MAQTRKPPTLPGARSLALDILAGARRRGGSTEEGLAAALARHPGLSAPERALLVELVLGVTRWEGRLDYVLSHLSDRGLNKLHPLVLEILRLGAYQLLFLDRVPARAALSEAGGLARTRGLPPALVGFINAVLRRLDSQGPPPLPEREADPVLYLSLACSHPPWLVQRWLGRGGFDAAQARLEANNQIPPLVIRVNTLKIDAAALTAILAREGIEASPCRFSPKGLNIPGVKTDPLNLESYRQGLWLFQDEAAQLATYLLGAKPGQRLLELGAGRGGKTTHLAEMLGNRGCLLAVDNHRGRLKELKGNLKRWGATAAHPLWADGTRPLPIKRGTVDAALVDAPCSALGIIRRHPEIKNRLCEADLATFPPRQLALLEQAAATLKPGGRLLYLTCTTEPEENEAVVARFLAEHPEFHPAPRPDLLPPPARHLVSSEGFFRTDPATHGLDGFFGALLVKT